MSNDSATSAQILEYFRALRTEIIEAQKLRIQVGLAKTVFLGTLLGYFFRSAESDLSILVCPFVALMFDCMVYGLSFNIRDVGAYIGEYLEPKMALTDPWQRHRAARVSQGFTDWGRIAFRVGSYGLSAAVSTLSFAKSAPPAGAPLSEWSWRIGLMAVLFFAWSGLIYAEFRRKQSAYMVAKPPEETDASEGMPAKAVE